MIGELLRFFYCYVVDSVTDMIDKITNIFFVLSKFESEEANMKGKFKLKQMQMMYST